MHGTTHFLLSNDSQRGEPSLQCGHDAPLCPPVRLRLRVIVTLK